jgi:hypothetical protein
MSLRYESIDVRVSQRILWFGNEAYPLHNITRTNFLKLVPNRSAAIRSHLRTVVISLLVAAVLAAFAPPAAATAIIVGVLAWLAYKTYKLVEFLKIELYELVIETAAGSHRGLVSTNGGVVIDLSRRITDAINNPHAEFEMRVENIHVGDNVNTYGDYSVGKASLK